MQEKIFTKKELIQGALSVWIIILAVLYLGPRDVFFEFFALSLTAFILFFSLYWLIKKREFGKVYSLSSKEDILAILQKMRSGKFENFVADLFQRLGYESERVGGFHKGAVDVLAVKGELREYVYCRKYRGVKVSLSEVRDFYNKVLHTFADGKTVFVSVDVFVAEAKAFAKEKSVKLIGGSDLTFMIQEINNKK